MNIQEIYGEQKPWLQRNVSDLYNRFIRDLDNDMDYSLSDDEAGDLFSELLLIYMRDTISYDECSRIRDKITKNEYTKTKNTTKDI